MGQITLKTSDGAIHPKGFSIRGNAANFSLFSSEAQKVTLGLFSQGALVSEIEMKKSADIWHIGIENLPENLEYAYRLFSPKNPSPQWSVDPYAKQLAKMGAKAALPEPFDWEGVKSPDLPKEDLIIYEMHIRGFTKHPSSRTKHPGTYLGVIEKIPYLKTLGITAIELMPIYAFETKIQKPQGKISTNYWGYSPIHFFSPSRWFAKKDPIFECKTMIKELHRNGIEVILDVVYNHTAEAQGPLQGLRSIDEKVYYMIDDFGFDRNFSGCGNTLNTNHPAMQELIIDSLLYWAKEMHIDGFRFDLASIFTRDSSGKPLEKPPILERIGADPILGKKKLIAEAWDAGGLYQLGFFPRFGPWSEWNGKYRDTLRRFIKGSDNHSGAFADALSGSESLYKGGKTPLCSINFITAHDGFCLKDLVSFQQKHNLDNGEENRDGCDQNDSWNCGVEGDTQDPKILALRERQMRNFLLALFISQGIPMLLMGDEQGHTRRGNNNPYIQDNEYNWLLWDKKNPKIFSFVAKLIALRKAQKGLRQKSFLSKDQIIWNNSWNPESKFVSFTLKKPSPPLFFAFNADFAKATVELPPGKWHLVVNTEEDFVFHDEGEQIEKVFLLPYSALCAIER